IRRKHYCAKTIAPSNEKVSKNEPEPRQKIGLEHLFETLAKKLSRFPNKFDAKSKIVVFDVHGHEEEWDEWASSRGIKIHCAFLGKF
uniref:Uncharacterized protein n=1 Tax=Romanomermis culicivorax TaxID=13658 RepID=A0A915J6I0_ROMCU